MSDPFALDQVQRLLQAAIRRDAAAQEPAHAALLFTELLAPSRQRTAAERLEVYQQAYFARLHECLQSEFPAVCAAVGPDLFAEFAAGYFAAQPSRSYTLAQLGARFPEHLAATRPPRASSEPDFADFLIELARLERTYAEVFDAPGPERDPGTLAAELQRLTPEEWAAARLRCYPTVRVLDLTFPVHEFASAVRRGESPELPVPQSACLIVTRRDYVVRRWTAPVWQGRLLQALLAGETLETSLQAAAAAFPEGPPADWADQLRAAFETWTRAALFQSVHTGRRSERPRVDGASDAGSNTSPAE